MNYRIIQAVLRWFYTVGALASAFFFLVVVLFPRANQLDNWLNPVRSSWIVNQSAVDGKDLIISGTMRKNRECTFQPPPRARDDFGNHFLVLLNQPLWVATGEVSNWGPWTVVDGANKKLEFFIIDRCHFLWDNSTILGEFGK